MNPGTVRYFGINDDEIMIDQPMNVGISDLLRAKEYEKFIRYFTGNQKGSFDSIFAFVQYFPMMIRSGENSDEEMKEG